MSSRRRWLVAGAIFITLLGACFGGVERVNPGYRPALSGALCRLLGQGRIEATEVDMATQIAGQPLEVRVREGDRVEAGEVVAVLDWLACGGLIENVGSHRRLDQGVGPTGFRRGAGRAPRRSHG
ncbi:MAG: hypothetical protein WAT36_06665 [Chromatiaceae bacterium]